MHNRLVNLLLECDNDVILYRYQNKWVSAGELKTLVWQKTHALSDRGFLPEQIVSIIAIDSLEWIATFWALSIIGCQVIVLHQTINKLTVDALISKHSIQHVITDRTDLSEFSQTHQIQDINSTCTEYVRPFDYQDHHFLVCFSTSGTSNNPRLVMQNEQGITHSIGLYQQWYKNLKTDSNSLFLSIPRMSWTPGFNINVVSVLMHRVPAVIGFGVTELKTLNVFCKSNPVTHILMSPYVAEMLVNSSLSELPDTIVSIAVGGEPLPLPVFEKFRDKFNHVLLAFYGLNEATCISSETGTHKNRSTGKLFNGIEYKIINDRHEVCSFNEPGVLHVRHPGNSMSYLGDPEMSAIVFGKDGWVSTNDVVSINENLEIQFHGRANSYMKIKGHWVSMYEVEQALLEFDQIKTAVVVQSIDKIGYNAMCAYIVPVKSVSEQEIRNWLLSKFNRRFMVPKQIKFVDDLPKTSSLKKIRNAELIESKLNAIKDVV